VALEGPGTTGPDGPALLTSGAARQKLPQAPSGLFFCPAGGMNKHDTPRLRPQIGLRRPRDALGRDGLGCPSVWEE